MYVIFSSCPIYFSDVGLSQDHPDQRTLRRFILSRTCGSMTPEMAGTVHAKAMGASKAQYPYEAEQCALCVTK